MTRKAVFLCAAMLAALTACNPRDMLESRQRVPAPTVPADLPSEVQAVLRDYDFAVNSLRALYLKPDVVGAKWQQTADAERKKIIQAESPDQYVPSLRAVIDALQDPDVGIALKASAAATQTFGGIGVMVDLPQQGKDRLLVLLVYPNSPAERGGIRAHDAIVSVDGQPVVGAEGGAVVTRLRGQPGSKVTLGVRTPGQPEREVAVTRRVIDASPDNTPLVSRLIDGAHIAYIAPNPSDTEFMRDEVAAALRELSANQPLDGLVLDLRLMRANDFPLESMLSLFVTGDQIGSTQSRATKGKILISGKGVAGSQDMRLAVLVSDLTVGQAEAFAGMLQDLGRAKLVGNTTRGSTAVVTRLTLPVSKLELIVPSGEYVGSKGESWYGKGITPVVAIEQRWEEYGEDDDIALNRAVEELKR